MERGTQRDHDWLAGQFEQNRSRLRAVAYRMLGSSDQADDAVQEAWLRLVRTDAEPIDNLAGWLTTVVARVCLDALRSRSVRGETPIEQADPEAHDDPSADPERGTLLSDAIGQALLVVLDRLSPSERVAFVLHDMFDIPFAEIAPIIDRSEAATRQLASRARRQVRGGGAVTDDPERQREVVAAFLVASRQGDLQALVALLHPDAVLRADAAAVRIAEANRAKGAPAFKPEIRGANDVAETLKGRAAGAHLAVIDGAFGAVWPPDGRPMIAFCFTVRHGRISAIDVVMERDRLDRSVVETINNNRGSGTA